MQTTEIKNLLRTLSIIYWAFFLSLILFTFVAGYIVSINDAILELDQQARYIFYLVLIVTVITTIPLSYWFPQKMINSVRGSSKTLMQKLMAYRSALLIRLFLAHSAGFLVAMFFLLVGNAELLYLQVIILLIFLIYKPSPFKIASDLELDDNEAELLIRGEE